MAAISAAVITSTTANAWWTMTLDEVIKELESRESEFSRRFENISNQDSLYYEGLSDAYGIALNLVKGVKR